MQTNPISGDERPPSSTITLSQLKDSVPEGETVITELDMVEGVLEVIKLEIAGNVSDTSATPIPEYQYFLSIVTAYAQSLLAFLIYPHRRLQMFMFDLCVDSNNVTTLQQLVNFHVILDTQDLLDRLVKLRDTQTPPIWIRQILLDVAKRMQRTDVVVETLLQLRRPMEVIEYIRKFDHGYEIEKVFSQLRMHRSVNRRVLWSQVELWNLTAGDDHKPVLSHQVIMMNSPVH